MPLRAMKGTEVFACDGRSATTAIKAAGLSRSIATVQACGRRSACRRHRCDGEEADEAYGKGLAHHAAAINARTPTCITVRVRRLATRHPSHPRIVRQYYSTCHLRRSPRWGACRT